MTRFPLFCLAMALTVQAQEPPVPREGALRLTVDRLAMPDPGEHMDLTGLSVLHPMGGGTYVGTSLYGATRGRRGGFFTGGFTAGWGLALPGHLRAEAGLFVGGGGGSAALVGGGLMLRAHGGLAWQAGDHRAGLQWSRVHFPNGAVSSSQLALAYERRFSSLAFPSLTGTSTHGSWPGFEASGNTFSLVAQRYDRRGGLHDTRMVPGIAAPTLAGFAWTRQAGSHVFGTFEMAAATLGQSDGYMEAFGGFGWRQSLTPGGSLSATARLLAGAGGGGALGVGGGFLLKGSAGLEFRHASGLLAAVEAGRIDSPSTPFNARTVTLRTGLHFGTVRAAQGSTASPLEMGSLTWQLRPFYQRFETSQRRTTAAIPAQPVESVGLKIDALVTPHLYLSGLATGATTGHAGGWATGMLGLGAQTPAWHGLRLFAEGHGGAGGGGGLSTEGGLLLRAGVGLAWEPSASWGIQALTGRIKAPKGHFNSPLIELALCLRSRRPVISPRS